jgi:hypothetical protein
VASELDSSVLTNQRAYLKYFTEFLPGILGKLMMQDLLELNCCIEIKVTDSEEDAWTLKIVDGCLSYVGHDAAEAQCCFLLDAKTLLDVVQAKVEPERAFFDMRIDIVGDVAIGLQLSTVLESFFAHFPFTLEGIG